MRVKLKRRKVFRVDLEMVHLAAELAAAKAMAREVERQFHEQNPGYTIALRDDGNWCSFPGITSLDIALDDKAWDIEYIGEFAEGEHR